MKEKATTKTVKTGSKGGKRDQAEEATTNLARLLVFPKGSSTGTPLNVLLSRR